MANIKIEENCGMISRGKFCIDDAIISFEIRNAELRITSSFEVPMEATVALIEELLKDYCVRVTFEGHKIFRRMDVSKVLYGEANRTESEGEVVQFPEGRSA